MKWVLDTLASVWLMNVRFWRLCQAPGLPQRLRGKESTCNAGAIGDSGSIPGSGRSPGGGHGNPPQYSRLENPHGQRSLAAYSPCGRTESDTTE